MQFAVLCRLLLVQVAVLCRVMLAVRTCVSLGVRFLLYEREKL
jgi:hypothetical protein